MIVLLSKISTLIIATFLVLATTAALSGLAYANLVGRPMAQAPAAPDQKQTLRLATTTSMQDSSLMDIILPGFEKANDAKVQVIAVGSGVALKMGEMAPSHTFQGDVCSGCGSLSYYDKVLTT